MYTVVDEGYPFSVSEEASTNRYIGTRIALPLKGKIPTNGVTPRRAEDGVLEVEYGYYPQEAAPKEVQKLLGSSAFSVDPSSKYTRDSLKLTDESPFSPKSSNVLCYGDKKYILVNANYIREKNQYIMEDGMSHSHGDKVLVEIAPVKWLVDEKANVMVTEKILFAGIPFDHDSSRRSLKKFEDADIKKYLDNYFSKELVQFVKEIKKEPLISRDRVPVSRAVEEKKEEECMAGKTTCRMPLDGEELKKALDREMGPYCKKYFGTPEERKKAAEEIEKIEEEGAEEFDIDKRIEDLRKRREESKKEKERKERRKSESYKPIEKSEEDYSSRSYRRSEEDYDHSSRSHKRSEEDYDHSSRSYKRSKIEKLNPDKTNPSRRTKMTDTEIIHNWIEAGESVLLRGPSGIGKTERIKELYPDLVYIKLTNNMFPEKVVGSVNLQTGQSVPPDFAKTVIMQEANEEEKKQIEENIQNIYDIADKVYERSKNSDKKIVIMLDELLNVKPAVQSLVYTLVLNRIVEIGKGLKLPDNVVVVATGNQKKYSNVAEDLTEPLEKRFAHILDMEPKVSEWITEYAIPKKVHPAVVGYMLTKYNASSRSDDLDEIGYFYEEPEVGEEHLDSNGCKGRTNDPRGWASISNTLYNFEKNLKSGKYNGKDIEDILERSINSKLREEWATEFFDFYNLPTLTPEEVVEGAKKGYAEEDLPRDTSERFAYTTALVTADESQVEECRKFIRRYCDPEYLAVYDIYWAGKSERRMEKLAELQELALELHSGKECEEYVSEGISAYSEIGEMYKESMKNKSNGMEKEDNDETR